MAHIALMAPMGSCSSNGSGPTRLYYIVFMAPMVLVASMEPVAPMALIDLMAPVALWRASGPYHHNGSYRACGSNLMGVMICIMLLFVWPQWL